jgi:hypothetical protein
MTLWGLPLSSATERSKSEAPGEPGPQWVSRLDWDAESGGSGSGQVYYSAEV